MSAHGMDVSKFMRARIDQAIEDARRMAESAHREAVRETIPEIETEYRGLYMESVAHWYAAYDPRKYHRNHSLFDLMELNAHPESMTLDYEISEAGMTTGTGGFSLWDMVFINGYHGGPRPGHTPTRSTPVQDMFVISKFKAEEKYRQLIRQRTYQKFYEMSGQT